MDVMCLKFILRTVLTSFLETLSLAIPGTGRKSKSVSAGGISVISTRRTLSSTQHYLGQTKRSAFSETVWPRTVSSITFFMIF